MGQHEDLESSAPTAEEIIPIGDGSYLVLVLLRGFGKARSAAGLPPRESP